MFAVTIKYYTFLSPRLKELGRPCISMALKLRLGARESFVTYPVVGMVKPLTRTEIQKVR